MEEKRISEELRIDGSEQEVNLRDYLAVIKKRAAIIITIVVVIFAWQVLKVSTATPIYTASSGVLIEKNQGAKNLDFQYSGWDPYFLKTQTEIIKSENVAARVVENLQLHEKYRKYFFPEVQEKPVIATAITNVKRFIKSLFPQRQAEQVSGPDGVVLDGVVFSAETYSDAYIISQIIRGGLDVTPVPESKIVIITYRHENPAIAKLIANAVVQAYKDITLEIKISAANYELQWMTTKAGEERKKLEDAENALQKYKRENDLVTVENKLAVIPQTLAQINTEFTRAQTERRELEEVYQQINNAGRKMAVLERIPLFSTNTGIQAIREKIFRAKQNQKELSKKYGPKHPLMIKAQDELDILNNEITFEVDRIIASTKNSYELAVSREKHLQERLAQTKTELLNINEKFVQLSIMQREVDTNRVLYDALTSNIKTTGVTEQAQNVNIWVVRKAEFPQAPSFPRKRRALALGLILGLAMGVGAAFVLEYLDNTVKSEKDLINKFNLTVLGTIELVKGAKREVESYILRQPLSPLAESYRLVRSNLLLSSAEHPPRTILVTSMGPKEGKTSTVINVARVLSQDDKKVLIIDCDLRKPRMHALFGMENVMGLSNYLTGHRDGNILYDIPGENIKLIPSGLIPPNPAELLSSRKMALLVKKMEERFDFVILDSPPIERVTDSLALSRIVAGTIVVIRARKTTYDMLFSGMKKLTDVHANLLGFVLNGVKNSEGAKGYYAGYTAYYAKDYD